MCVGILIGIGIIVVVVFVKKMSFSTQDKRFFHIPHELFGIHFPIECCLIRCCPCWIQDSWLLLSLKVVTVAVAVAVDDDDWEDTGVDETADDVGQ